MHESYYRQVQRRLAANVRKIRQRLGMTQEDVAHVMSMATRHYQKLESGELNITLKTLTRVAQAFGMDIQELFVSSSDKEAHDGEKERY
ncbi:MAG TPA: helix-turn-helix transcriptional regulator [Ktedonobacteraceae bacterium]|jgi:transcriptional regulator with XRE-family HTH domain